MKQTRILRFTKVLFNSPIAIHLQGSKGMDVGWKCSKRVKPQYRGNNIMYDQRRSSEFQYQELFQTPF